MNFGSQDNSKLTNGLTLTIGKVNFGSQDNSNLTNDLTLTKSYGKIVNSTLFKIILPRLMT